METRKMSLYESLLERMDGHSYDNYFSAWCVWDTHQSPALLVFRDGMCKCLSCNKIGTHAQLDRKLGARFRPQSNHRVSRVLPAWKKWEEEYGDLEGIALGAHQNLKRFATNQSYFKKRKIYEYMEEGQFGFLSGWACFPVFDVNKRVVDIVVRSTGKHSVTRYVVSPLSAIHSFLYSPDWSRVLREPVIYCVYGLIDSWAIHALGLPCITGITGKSLNADLIRPLDKRIIIVPDMGEEDDAYALANKIGWKAKVKKLVRQDDEKIKDPDSIRVHFGNEYLLNMIGA